MHKFPRDTQRANLWRELIGVERIDCNNARVCGNHFKNSDFRGHAKSRITAAPLPYRRLENFAVPSLYLPPTATAQITASPINVENTPTSTTVQITASTSKIDVGIMCEESIPFSCCLEYRKKYEEAQVTIENLEKQLQEAKHPTKKEEQKLVKKHLSTIGHNETAIKHILKPKRHHNKNYAQEDICNALVMKCMSTKMFEFIRKNKMMSLPSRQTMTRWLGNLTIKPGHQTSFISLLEKKHQFSESYEKEGMMMFDEMDIKNVYEYDAINRQVYGDVKKVQCVMVRGLYSAWKQVIFFDFDTSMDKNLITSLILKCEAIGIRIRGISFDLGNPTFLREFGILNDLTHFMTNPADATRVIYFFPDVPHLLKLCRNHILDKGLRIYDEDGNSHDLTKLDFQRMIERDGQEFKVCLKLTELLVNVQGQARQRVRYAAQLLSNTVGKGLVQILGVDYTEQSNTILCINRKKMFK